MVDVTHSSDFAPSGLIRGVWASRAGDFSKAKIAVLFVALMAIVSIPVLLNPLPPISDYINHLARMHVIATIGSDPNLSRFYEIDWQVIPNLMMDLIVPAFARVMGIYQAGELYTLLSFALILSGTVALHRQLFGRWSPLPLVAAVLLYNTDFLVGTMNYVFGIGLMLWALAAWIRLRERSWALRLSVSALMAVGLFFCHLFVLGVYAVGLFAFETQRLWSKYSQLRASSGAATANSALPRLLIDYAATGLPFVPVLALLLMSPTSGLSDRYWEFAGKFDGLVYVVKAYSNTIALAVTAIIALSVIWALMARALAFHAFGLVLLVVGAVVYLALPRVMFDTYMVDQRLPIALAFMLLASLNLDFRSRAIRLGFAVGLVLLLGVRVAEVETNWSQLSGNVQSFRQSVQLLDKGSKVVVAYADPNAGDSVRDYGLMHADCIATIERSALVTTAFTVVGKQVMHARAAFRDRVDTQDGTPPSIAAMLRVAHRQDADIRDYWRNWTTDYDYLYVLFTEPGFRKSRSREPARSLCRRPVHALPHREDADDGCQQAGEVADSSSGRKIRFHSSFNPYARLLPVAP